MPVTIYRITNILDGKIYVGFTQRTLEERFGSHRYSTKQKPHYPLYAAMLQDGFDKFTIEPIEELPNGSKDLYERELYWIEYFNSAHPYGYNFDKTSLKRLEIKARGEKAVEHNELEPRTLEDLENILDEHDLMIDHGVVEYRLAKRGRYEYLVIADTQIDTTHTRLANALVTLVNNMASQEEKREY